MHPVILRNILFPKESVCPKAELYFRTAKGGAYFDESENALVINKKAEFDTYFNSFATVKYKEYCRLSNLFLRLRVCGFFVLRIFGVNGKEEKCIINREIKAPELMEDITDISEVLETDFTHIYFTLESESGKLYGGNFFCKSEKPNDVSIAVVICTYKREEFLMRNHRSICEYIENSSEMNDENIHFYIVDNGKTLKREEVENNTVTLIPNGNTGGSGGFTRGYYESLKSGRGHTHILFMDDDIVLDCEMLLRVYSLLRLRKSEYKGLSVGGTMLKLSDFVTQHEAGAIWNGKRLESVGNGLDMTDRNNVFETVNYPDCNYNAWWFYCFPSEWQEKYGYPLQFFIKEDDIEYSLRCAQKIAIINGIAVWHEDFEGKYDGFQEYYIKRNELILSSVNRQKAYAIFQVRKLILCVMRQAVYQRYFLADIVIRAYDDYLKGWKHFKDTDTEQLNKELMNSCKPLLSDEELKEYGVYFDEEKYNNSLTEQENLKVQAISLNGYLIPYCFYKKDKDGFYITDLAKCRYVNFYKHKKILHYDIKRRKGFVTEQKKLQLLKYMFLLIVKSIKFLVKYPSVRKGYKTHLKELSEFDKK